MSQRGAIFTEKYLSSMSTYIDLPDGIQWMSTRGVVYKLDKERGIKCYIDADFSGGWAQSDADSVENSMLCLGYIITYLVCQVI